MIARTLHLLLFVLLLAACVSTPEQSLAPVPLVPIGLVVQGGAPAIWWRAPVRVQDKQMRLATFDAAGRPEFRTVDAAMFPTDVLITYSSQDNTARVFLRRSPHSGCLLLLREDPARFEDPCYGSTFDLGGEYLGGPAPRDLDQLPATVQGDMIWITPQIIYGAPQQ